jgi:hypothetical protein
MEFKAKIMVNIATRDGATTIIGGTMTIAMVAGTTIGGGEFRGLTNRSAKTGKWITFAEVINWSSQPKPSP